MRREKITVDIYENENNNGIVLSHPPLFIEQHDSIDHYPKLLHSKEVLRHQNVIKEKTPTDTTTFEVIEHDYTLYYAENIDSLSDAIDDPKRAINPMFIYKDEFVLELTEKVIQTSLNDVTDEEQSFHQMETSYRAVLSNSNKPVIISRTELDDWISKGHFEHLIPLDVTKRNYQN